MKILSIGNSFSRDAQRYLYRLSLEAGIPMKSVNLVIGGCSLAKHFRNMHADTRDLYSLEVNGEPTDLWVSLREALVSDDWDFITLQQCSAHSPNYETYQPYLSELSAYVKRLVPKAKQVIHQVWPYEEGSQRLTVMMGCTKPEEMLEKNIAAYSRAAADIEAHGIIPSGVAMLRAYRSGVSKMYQDTWHAGHGAGRLLLAELWLTALSGADMRGVRIPKLDVPVSDGEIGIIREIAYEAAKEYGWIKA